MHKGTVPVETFYDLRYIANHQVFKFGHGELMMAHDTAVKKVVIDTSFLVHDVVDDL
jgi:hypothetical protein